ncbi:MAG: hypothetical protein AB8G86_00435 [Saprospiraceae bacterium]
MAKEFKSRMSKIYYAKSKKTKKGNTTYFLTTKLDDSCLDIIPKEYEVYENYTAQMLYLRKKKKSGFSAKDIALIKTELSKNESIDGFELNIHGDEIKIYDLEDKSKHEPSLLEMIPNNRREIAKAYFMQYTENMCIKKVTKKEETEYLVMRFCYRSAIDDWIVVDAGEDLATLAANNLVHLGKESFFDLYPIR